MSTPTVTVELAREHGLTPEEYQRLVDALGRTPRYTELGIASVMWSEHCSYKSSRLHLKNLPTEGPHVIEGPGENAGVVDIGDNQAVVFKMESHNHPSFIEPYQGAATGVGGICRDVFTMGARPIALADCLRFGSPKHPRTHYLINGVVAGIGNYGNCFGVPNIAGDVHFDSSYDGNILVNAFCLGLAPADRIFRGYAAGVGNPILYVGAKTGRDGIHGATMASAEFGEDSEAKRPAVQVGDPFMEKLLLEACLELMQSDILVGIQDMGAAGLTSSSVEMAARAGSGVSIDLSKVPQREQGMTPYEIMLSESQERMLMVVKRGHEQQALDIFQKWDLDAAVVGTVTDSGKVVVTMGEEVHAELPADVLAEGLVYDRPSQKPAYLERTQSWSSDSLQQPEDLSETLLKLLAQPGVASKEWVYRQYDHDVRHGTVVRPGAADAGVIRVLVPASDTDANRSQDRNQDQEKGVAVSAGCTSRYVYLDPYEGTKLVVAEAYANLVAVGAKPLAVTNCLNFGNPENPGTMWQFVDSVRGLGDACRMLETPIVSGNVSLYNETDGVAIKPTPMIAMVGTMPDVGKSVTLDFKQPGHHIAVVGELGGALAGSEYQQMLTGDVAGVPTPFAAAHQKVLDALLAMSPFLASAHDVSDGGLLVALAESAIAGPNPIGATIDLSTHTGRPDALLFGESPARFVISFAPDQVEHLAALATNYGIAFHEIGTTGGDRLNVTLHGGRSFSTPLNAASQAWKSGFADVAK